MGKTLVIYYSRKGQNYVNGSIKNLPKEIQKLWLNLFAMRWDPIFLK